MKRNFIFLGMTCLSEEGTHSIYGISHMISRGHPAFSSRCWTIVDQRLSDVTLQSKPSTHPLACRKFCTDFSERAVYTIRQFGVDHVLGALSDGE